MINCFYKFVVPLNSYTVFHIGFIPIQVWGLFVALGMALAFLITWKRVKTFGFEAEKTLNLWIWMIVGGFVGARFFHAFFYDAVYFWQNPIDIFKFWQGGLSSIGGIIGAFLAFFIFIKKKKISKENWLGLADIFAFSALFGWMLGRVGCVMIHDHPGIIYNSFLSVQTSDGQRLDMAALEIIGLIPLVLVFLILKNKRKHSGWFIGSLFIYYGALRFVLDFFRAVDIIGADARYLGLTPAQYFGIVLVAVGAVFLKLKIWKGKVRIAV